MGRGSPTPSEFGYLFRSIHLLLGKMPLAMFRSQFAGAFALSEVRVLVAVTHEKNEFDFIAY